MTDPFSKFRWNDHPVRVALKGVAGQLATVMYNKAKPDGSRVFGSQSNLAAMVGCSTKSIERAQAQLMELGLVHRVEKGSGRSGKSSEFILTMPPEIPDISTEHLDCGIPDIPLNTRHGCPEYQTSVSRIPDMGVCPIDPLTDPGNKPGSVEEERDIFDVLPPESDTGSVRPDPFSEAYIFDDRPVDSPPIASQHRLASRPKPANEGTAPMSYNPSDPFGPGPVVDSGDRWPPEPTKPPVVSLTPPAAKPVDEFSRRLDEDHRRQGKPVATPWPHGKPFVPGEFDPFATYVDDTTGQELNPYG